MGTVSVVVASGTPATATSQKLEQSTRVITTDARVGEADRAVIGRSGRRHERESAREQAAARTAGQRAADERADERAEQEERSVALAAAWHLDPTLLEPQVTDSSATAAARRELGEIHARFGLVVATYDAAVAVADDAETQARDARFALTRAEAALAVATEAYRLDRELFVSVLTEAYTTESVTAYGRLMSAESDEDLVHGLMLLQEMGRSQSSAVQAADASRERLRVAKVVVASAEAEARRKVDAARGAVYEAALARHRLVTDLRAARTLLKDAVLADQLTAARAYDVAGLGDVVFPLPASAAYADLDNWGRRSKHWAKAHTGDDFAAPCGTAVLAATAGTVEVRTDQSWSGPWLVTVTTGAGGLSTWYAHLQALAVEDGAQVEAGTPLGVVGAEGNATGCHLHFEVHPDGGSIYEDNVDPVDWLHRVGAYPG